MPIGPGKYDAICTRVREETNARAAVVVILSGGRGSGFSMQLEESMLPVARSMLPGLLREVATMIENDARELG